ncbi:MAG: hypothetical protein NTU53_00515 [Planctomycetota bacterium]|nr:hypothetical protein [Planctomycetota bacterium]
MGSVPAQGDKSFRQGLAINLADRTATPVMVDNGAVLIKRFRLLGLKWSSWRRKQFRNGDPGLAGHRVEEIRTAIGIHALIRQLRAQHFLRR